MKRIYMMMVAVIATMSANAQSVFFEDFEGGLLNQMTQEYVVGTHNWVTSATGINLGGAPAAFEGDSAAHFYYPGYTGYITTLTTPSLDLSAGGYKLGFALAQPNWIGDQNTLSVYYSGDDGASWILVDSIGADLATFQEFEFNLDDYATLTATSKLRFSGWIDYGYAIGLDAVNVFLPPADDAEVVAAISPTTGCGLGDQEVSIVVFNNGLNAISTIDASYILDANQAVSQTFSVSIAAGETDTLTFTSLADLSVLGMHDLTIWTDLANDLDAANDTIEFSVNNIPVIATLPYFEDFENGAGGWAAGGNLVDWELGDPETAFIDTAHSGINAWVTNLDGPYQNGTDQYVESPCMDFSALSVDPVFRFEFITSAEIGWDGTWIEISTDAGTTWTTVGSVGEGTNWYNNADEHGANFDLDWWDAPLGGADEWITATHLLTGAAGESSVKIRVFFHSDVSGIDEGFAFDDVQIFEQPSINAGVVEILSPVNGCGLTANETVTVVLQNFGDADLVDFNVEYNAGSGIITEMVTDTLFSATTDTFTFTTPVDLSVAATYNFGAWTAIVGDGDALNDSLFVSVTNSPIITSLPYMEDFENGQGGWITGGTNSSWELGEPAGAFIDTASSGINAWVTNLDGFYNLLEQSYVESPCFDFSSLQIDPELTLAGIVSSEEGWDGAWIETSVDGGATWTVLGAAGEGTNWYNDEAPFNTLFPTGWDGELTQTGIWFEASHLLDGTAGYSSVKIGVNFTEDGFFNEQEGFGFDNIRIEEQPAINGALTAVTSPTTGCGLSAAESITVEVANLGYITMDSIMVSYMVNNGTPMMEVFDGPLALGGDTTLTFSTTIDMSVPGDYDLTVWVTTVGDGDTSNDTLNVMVTNVPIVANFPYNENFENGAGGWTSMGTNGMWQLGDPEGILIDTAYSGVNAWATNLDSLYYNDDQLSYLVSPCLDFSNMSDDPIISFAFIGQSEQGFDGMWLEVTTDGGTTWTTVGQVGEGTNWYNNADEHGVNFDLDWWDGQTDGWLVAERLLDGVAGESSVQVRFVFNADNSFSDYEGFAVDDINIRPQPQLDLVIVSMEAPLDGCSLDQETVTVTFWNKGLQTVSGFNLGFMVDGNTAQTETYTGSVAHGDSATYTFTTEMADLSTAGVHYIDVFTALAGDENVSNDTLYNNLVENFGTGTPLSQTEMPGLPISSTILEGTTSQIFFCGLPQSLDGCLEIESVVIDSISHTWLADLDIYLISPAGDTLELSTDNGGSADNMSNVVFTDTSTNDITLQTLDILPGYYHTEDSLGFASLYNGQDPNGAWSLFIIDDTGGDQGELISWSMTFTDNSPSPVIAYSDTSICLTHILDVSTDEYDSYLWSTGHNSQTAQLYGNVLGLGQHEIYVTVDQDGCTGVSNSFTLTVDACAGIEELGNLEIEVYPNPSNGIIVLNIEGSTAELGLTVLDLNGRMVYSERLGEVNSRLRKNIDLKGLANGVYLLQLTNGTDSLVKKLVIQ